MDLPNKIQNSGALCVSDSVPYNILELQELLDFACNYKYESKIEKNTGIIILVHKHSFFYKYSYTSIFHLLPELVEKLKVI